MKTKVILLSCLIISSHALATESLSDWFSKGSVNGNIKYYYIETNKENSATNLSSKAYASSIGGGLNYKTADYRGASIGLSFMTTNPFSLPSGVDTSIIGRDDGIRLENSAGGSVAQKGFSVLGESFINYKFKDFDVWYGRRVVKTPLIHSKDVRMIPSSIEGGDVSYNYKKGLKVGIGYVSRFKQRTSSEFVNIIEHALGINTQAIIGHTKGYVIPFHITYQDTHNKFRIYDYYAADFMNSLYFDFENRGNLNPEISYTLGLQGIKQNSVGHSRDAMNANTASYGGEIDTSAFGMKIGVSYKESGLNLAYSNVLNSSKAQHNSLVMPWDGTPLFTNTITSSNLFSSNYSKGLTSSAGYIAGTQGLKLSYEQKYNFIGLKGIKTIFSYGYFDNDDFNNPQEDVNAVISYGFNAFSIALKGIWVKYSASNSSSDSASSISQIDSFRQYRIIANYKF